MRNVIPVSFKNTTRDMKLLIYLNNQEEKSQFIKNAIEFYINHLEKTKNKDI